MLIRIGRLQIIRDVLRPVLIPPEYHFEGLTFAFCTSCRDYSLWLGATMIFPHGGEAPDPSSDLPKAVREIYEEARRIVSLSPRASAALLRLAIQRLTNDILGQNKGKDLDDSIKKLVAKGLPIKIQKSLDIVRVIGNNAVHPGTIDFDSDDATHVVTMFDLVNLIAESMITQSNTINKLYDSLPENARRAITNRDWNT
jgi:hypothetical protein